MENKQDKGFTLVELLIVIVILGILATVTVFAVRGITDQGQTSACDADKKTLETAVEAFYAQNGHLRPVRRGDLVPISMPDFVKVARRRHRHRGSMTGLTGSVISATR